jgi:hypothetical protein
MTTGKEKQEYKQVSVKITATDYDRLMEYANKKGGIGLTPLVRMAVSGFLENHIE